MDAQDHELLARFRIQRDESAFHRLVDRHLGMVYAVAKRVTDNSALAEEVAQATFVKLADKSVGITRETALAGWLYQTSRRLALSAVRSDARRRQREQIAATMNLNEPGPRVVAEHLESAMDQLKPEDRDALVLRFLEDRSLRDVGHELGLSKDAARMRVNRALEKLRGVFGKLGITGSAAWLGTTLTTSATASVPTGLGATITTAVLSGTAAAATTAFVTQTTTTTMNLLNLKTAAAILGAAAVTGTTTYLVQEREVERVRSDYQTLNQTHAKLASDQQEALAMIQLRDEQIERLKRDVTDLPRLRGEVDRLNRNLEEMKALESEIATLHQQVEEARKASDQPSQMAGAPVIEVEPDERFMVRYGLWTSEAVAKAQLRRLDQHRMLGLGLIRHAGSFDGWFPQTSKEAEPYLLEAQLDLRNVELLFSGHVSDLKEPAQTIVARQSRVSKSAAGHEIWQVYTFGDGHSEIHAATNLEELAAWENERTIPRELQSRRPQ